MKLEDVLDVNLDIFETASAGVTSVQSIGSVEYAAKPNLIKLYKRNEENKPCCIARIQRKPYKGWSMVMTDEWDKFELPHFGYLQSVKTPMNGMKTISKNLPMMLNRWGVKYNDLKMNESLEVEVHDGE